MLERLRLGGLSGTYRSRSAELARDKKPRTISVTVLFLDDSTYTFHIEVSQNVSCSQNRVNFQTLCLRIVGWRRWNL